MTNPRGEMPFLEHLEELRSRLLRSILALVVGVGVGFWAVLRFDVVRALKTPIAPFLPGGRLAVFAPTEPFMITMKLGLLAGAVLASPVILYQVWAFLSPALYEREKKAMIPALAFGLLLFLAGGVFGWLVAMPLALKFLLGFQPDVFNAMISYKEYFSFVTSMLLGLGLAFELPLVMIVLAWLGIFDARRYGQFRRFAVLGCFIAGALLSPGGDLVTMLIYTGPLLALYELGVLGSRLVRRRAPTIAAGVLLLLLAAPPVEAQVVTPLGGGRPRGSQAERSAGDTLRRPGEARRIDSSTAKRLGLPSGPERRFPEPDSVMRALLERTGFAITRFLGDTAILLADSSRIVLTGKAATDREGAILEAGRIVYDDPNCSVIASGEPRLFEEGKIAVGRTLRFDTCQERGIFGDALTTFDELGGNWFVRGNLAVDSSASRLYAAGSEFTSCDLPVPHYSFVAGQVKWVSQSVLVARPAVLYIRDVPIAWLPFLFQDTKPGRRSGILIPQFGFNDIVRPTRGYNRQVTNIGYYWAPNDYVDLTARFDWFSNRYIQYGGELRYDWLDRQISGGLGASRQVETEGGSSFQFRWQHAQRFSAATTLNLSLNYVSDSRIVAGNAVDPLQTTQQILSSLNLTRRFRWGQVTLGGLRRQSVTDGSGTQGFPTLAIAPNPIDFGTNVTWSPSFTLNNETQFKTPLPTQVVVRPDGGLDTLAVTGGSRSTSIDLQTPLRLWGFNWRNAVRLTDRQVDARQVVTRKIPNEATPDPTDSLTVTEVRGGDFASGLDWETGFNLPQLFRGSLKLQPTVNIRNASSGAFLLRNAYTNGEWIAQSKRLEFGFTATPAIFGFLNRPIGPIQRFRHALNPLLNFAWSPEAEVSAAYARAANGGREPTPEQLTVPQRMTFSIGLQQTFEGKPRRAAGDTGATATDRPAIKLLALTTSPIVYDFEQAKREGRTGWVTPAITNSVQSDLIRGLQLSLTHDLWEGQVGTDTARFSPFLANVQANFSLTGGTFRGIGRLLGLVGAEDAKGGARRSAADTMLPTYASASNARFRPGSFGAMNQGMGLGGGGEFRTSVTYSLSRQRNGGGAVAPLPTQPGGFPEDPLGGLPIPLPGTTGAQSNLGLNAAFSPTPFWTVSWQTQYNVTQGRFESHQVQLQRDLHDWRASFNFVRNPNGNFALFFSVYLLNLPDIKFDYNQTTLQDQ
ncbi:MAG TPA: twin-arginine translocase subunit TatC [Gemmatimonadales bacterium]|nr:twin-arginine translocase subunit TatC [Gemmatimonadales bacterium]